MKPPFNQVSRGEAAARFAKEQRVSLAAAARRFGISRERARQKWREIFGELPTPMQKVKSQLEQAVADLARQGLSIVEIAASLEIGRDSVCRIRNRLDFAVMSHHDKIAVTKETKAKIVALAAAGNSRAEIVRETGANYSVVTKYLGGRSTHGKRRRNGRSAMASEVMETTGCSLDEAAAMFVIAPPSLHAYRKRRGLRTIAISNPIDRPDGKKSPAITSSRTMPSKRTHQP